jgi:hypothetical protein
VKKVFVEPDMQKIELNLRENIASSTEVNMGYYFTTDLFSCTIVTTGKRLSDGVTLEEAAACLFSSRTRSIMRFYPREEVIPHFKR